MNQQCRAGLIWLGLTGGPALFPGIYGETGDIANWPAFIQEVRESTLSYIDQLPNYLCRETVQRYAFFDRDTREILDEIVSELSFYEKTEHRKVLSIGGKPVTELPNSQLAGPSSQGEFATSLRSLFDPEVSAEFRFEKLETIRGHKTARAAYSVPLETSRSQISLGSHAITTGYRGKVWIALDSLAIVRIEDEAVDLPPDFPITASASRTEFALVPIGDKEYWLPESATMTLSAESSPKRGGIDFYHLLLGEMGLPNLYPPKVRTVNQIKFERYRKFEATVKIRF